MSVHAVHYVTGDLGDGLQTVDALVLGAAPESGATLDRLYAIENGVLNLKVSVPHGSAAQGHTWF
jgi:hypothetical protein